MRVIVLTLLVSCATATSVQQRWDRFLADRDTCEVEEDCTLVYSGCPLGCYDPVAVDHLEEAEAFAETLIGRYEAAGHSCTFGCPVPPEVTCAAGRCVVLETDEETEEETEEEQTATVP